MSDTAGEDRETLRAWLQWLQLAGVDHLMKGPGVGQEAGNGGSPMGSVGAAGAQVGLFGEAAAKPRPATLPGPGSGRRTQSETTLSPLARAEAPPGEAGSLFWANLLEQNMVFSSL